MARQESEGAKHKVSHGQKTRLPTTKRIAFALLVGIGAGVGLGVGMSNAGLGIALGIAVLLLFGLEFS
jgi:hypothetical protein